MCYLPFIFWNWQGFSAKDLDIILSILLYNGLAILVGILKGRETKAPEELLHTETLAVMGRSLAAAAHDMRSPLMLIESPFTLTFSGNAILDVADNGSGIPLTNRQPVSVYLS